MYDIAIIGAGPTGASAGILAAKAGKLVIVIDDGKSVTRRALVKNYYGIPEITGEALMAVGIEQLRGFGAEVVTTHAKALEAADGAVRVRIAEGEGERTVEARHVILASGFSTLLAEHSGITTRPGTEPRVKTIVAVDAAGRTNLAGVWAAGTVAGVSVHVAVTAGDGARVVINVLSELNGERFVDHDFVPAG